VIKVSNTLSGLFSQGGKPDVAMIEELVEFLDVFDGFSFEEVPDVRVIQYHGYPVMAMTRLSTRESGGKANLHQGAVGLEIDIAIGKTLKAVQPITHHPDTGRDLSGLNIPLWHTLLCLVSSCHAMAGLGYLGADIVLDNNKGALLLELNARPGLAIQITNGVGLELRLKLIEKEKNVQRTAEECVNYSMQAFC